MAIPHVQAGQVVSVAALGAELAERPTTALFKSGDLEVMRLVLRAGKALPAHSVAGEITIQCIEGRLALDLGAAQPVVLEAQQLVLLAARQVHSVRALEDASALVTIALKPPGGV